MGRGVTPGAAAHRCLCRCAHDSARLLIACRDFDEGSLIWLLESARRRPSTRIEKLVAIGSMPCASHAMCRSDAHRCTWHKPERLYSNPQPNAPPPALTQDRRQHPPHSTLKSRPPTSLDPSIRQSPSPHSIPHKSVATTLTESLHKTVTAAHPHVNPHAPLPTPLPL